MSQAAVARSFNMEEECRRTRLHAGLVLAQAQSLLERLDRSNGRLSAEYRQGSLPAWMVEGKAAASAPRPQALAA